MLSDFKKSIDNILYERLSSPLFGAFIFSWCIWNWKIIYLTIFVDSKLVGNKIDFITKNYFSDWQLLYYPILSTLFLILVYPLISTGAFWTTLKFEKIKNDLRNKEQNKQLLSLEQSIQLREEVRSQDEKFDKLLSKKNNEIELLTKEIENYRKQLNVINQSVSELPTETKETIYQTEFNQLKSNEKLYKEFEKISPRAQKELNMFPEGHTIDRQLFDYFLANDIIENGIKVGIYKFTDKGKFFNKLMLNEKLFK
jgi:hypothetical protein